VRLALCAASTGVLAVVLGYGLAGLPAFGAHASVYGRLAVRAALEQRHVANAVTEIVFDVRGFDTLGEELILVAAAAGTALLLRETRDAEVHHVVDRVRSDGVAAASALAAIATFVLGFDVVAHGLITPGGGFQGGVVVAAGLLWLFLGVEYAAFRHLGRTTPWEAVESIGAGGYVAVGLAALAAGSAFLANVLPHGTTDDLTSGGASALLNWASATAVAGGIVVVFAELLEDAEATRYGIPRSATR
jgi:multicomponent Na+:H+ antiporter subunit B